MSCNRKITFSSCSMLFGKILAKENSHINGPKGEDSELLIHPKGEKEFNSVVQQKDHVLVCSMLLGKILAKENSHINDPKREDSKLLIHPKGEKEFNRVMQQKDHVLVVFYAPW